MPKVKCPRCIVCGQYSTVEITDQEWYEWHDRGFHIQHAMYSRSADFRELLLTGTHNGCWMTMYYFDKDGQAEFAEFLTKWMAMYLGAFWKYYILNGVQFDSNEGFPG